MRVDSAFVTATPEFVVSYEFSDARSFFQLNCGEKPISRRAFSMLITLAEPSREDFTLTCGANS